MFSEEKKDSHVASFKGVNWAINPEFSELKGKNSRFMLVTQLKSLHTIYLITMVIL